MRNEWIIARVGLLAAVGLACLMLPGCWSGKWDGAYPAVYVTDGERTSIEWVSSKVLDDGIENGPVAQYQKTMAEKSVGADGSRSLAATLAVAGVGLAVDAIKAQADAAAKTYEQQWTARNTNLDFWGDRNAGTAQGFVLKRTTESFGDNRPAFELKVALVPVPYQPGLLALRPVSCRLLAARANSSSGQITIKLDGELSTSTLNKTEMEVTSLGKFTIDLGSVAVPSSADGTTVDLWEPETFWHIFPAPVATGTDKDGRGAGGILALTIAATETDTGKGKQVIETFSKFLGEQKGAITDYVKRRLPDNEQ